MVKGLPSSTFNSISGIPARPSSGNLRPVEGKPREAQPGINKTADKTPFQAALERRAQTSSKPRENLTSKNNDVQAKPVQIRPVLKSAPAIPAQPTAPTSNLNGTNSVAPLRTNSVVKTPVNNKEEKTLQVGELIEDFVEEMSEKYQLSPSLVAQSLDLSDPMKFFVEPSQAAQNIVGQLGLTGEEKNQAQQLTEGLFANLKSTLTGLSTETNAHQNANFAAPGINANSNAQLFNNGFGTQSPIQNSESFLNALQNDPAGLNGFTGEATSELSSRAELPGQEFAGLDSLSFEGQADRTSQASNNIFNINQSKSSNPAAQTQGQALTREQADILNSLQSGYINTRTSQESANLNQANLNQTNGIAGAPGFQSTETMLNAMGLDQMARQYAQGSNQKLGLQKAGASYGFSSVKPSTEDGSSLINSSVSGVESGVQDFEKENNLESWLQQNSEQFNQLGGQQNGQQQGLTGKSDFEKLLINAGVQPEHMKENMQNMVESARLMTTKGGGSMDVELRPEGLGKVQLKVSVEGEQVQIQMVADSKQSQAILKEGLEELKAQLAGQKLNVESIKVDLSQDLSRQQDFAQGGREQQRHAGQDMMQQFREERNQSRQGWEPNSPRPFARPNQTKADVQPSQARVRSFDGRLNVVA